MKIMITGCALLLCFSSLAQQAPNSKAASGKTNSNLGNGRLESMGAYQAKAPGGTLRIYNPTVRALNNRTEYGNTRLFGDQSLLALPKGTYGYANGQIWLRSTGATSIGGITGNSSVGNGSSSGGVGAASNVLGVNGKNPYAGPAMWGSANGLKLPDSVLRRNPSSGALKKD